VTVRHEGERWYVSFTAETEVAPPIGPKHAAVGVDRGVAVSVSLSTGERVTLPTTTEREQEKIAILQRRIASKKKGSANRRKACRQLVAYRCRLANRKRDAMHKLTTRLARGHWLVCIEDLRIKNMTAGARGTLDEPGHNVAQKAGLNRSILDQSWGEFHRQLRFKCAWGGVEPRTCRPGVHEPGVLSLRAPRSRKPQEPSGVLLPRVRALRSGRRQRGGQHSQPRPQAASARTDRRSGGTRDHGLKRLPPWRQEARGASHSHGSQSGSGLAESLRFSAETFKVHWAPASRRGGSTHIWIRTERGECACGRSMP